MKRLILMAILVLLSSTLWAQGPLSLVMRYQWTMDAKSYEMISENVCTDGIEFDFATKKAWYYTPDADISETLCNIVEVELPVTNADQSKTYGFKLFQVGSEKPLTCSMNVSKDLRVIKFTMIEDKCVKLYRVSNMITEDVY